MGNLIKELKELKVEKVFFGSFNGWRRVDGSEKRKGLLRGGRVLKERFGFLLGRFCGYFCNSNSKSQWGCLRKI
jgi:hypothetical protein